jgi:group I intron endonuclease
MDEPNRSFIYSVYKHTNLTNNKCYIGITRRDPKVRWGHNGYNYTNSVNKHFANAIEKYGWDGFAHEVLFSGLSKEDAENKEIELIAQYKSNQAEFGYNIENGGNCRGKTAEITKQRISQSNTGKKRTEEAKQKMRDVALRTAKERSERLRQHRLGCPSWNAGMVLSEEYKDKMKSTTYHAVRCVETGVVYKSISFAARELGLQAPNISKVCNGLRNHTGGYRFEYVN